jgi:hypothetical protein
MDDDDWTGTPPEGHHDRSRADPGFWARNPAAAVSGGVLFVLVVVVVILIVASK